MSYEIANASELLGQFASNGGYADLRKAVGSYPGGNYPVLAEFFEYGCTKGVDACIAELKQLAKDTDDENIRSTATGLAEMIKGEKLIIITNGVIYDDDDDDEDEEDDVLTRQ
jgi:hypothetical protein